MSIPTFRGMCPPRLRSVAPHMSLILLLIIPHALSFPLYLGRRSSLRPGPRLFSYSADGTYQPPPENSSSGPVGPALVSVDNLSVPISRTAGLRDASFVLHANRVTGLIGRNGCGKSTLLRILGRDLGLDGDGGGAAAHSGNVEWSRGVRVAYVRQDPPSLPEGGGTETAGEALFACGGGPPGYVAAGAYLRAVSAGDDAALARASEAMEGAGGWDVLSRAEEVATRLRVAHLRDRRMADLSGGEQKRVALAAAIVTEPELLLLDEPTNHLDLDAMRWLSDLLNGGGRGGQRKAAALVVTHDRAFLEGVCDDLLEIDRGEVHRYPTAGYGAFLSARATRLGNEAQALQVAKQHLKKEQEWMRRQPQGRQTKQNARQQEFYNLKDVVTSDANRAGAMGAGEAGGGVDLDAQGNERRRLGEKILKCNDVCLSFDKRGKMLDNFAYQFNAGDRIGVVGSNGVGKSTFLKVLTGRQVVDSGSVEAGETIVFGVYDQMGLVLPEDMRVLDFVKQRVEAAATGTDPGSMAETPQEAMKLLKKFNFERDRWDERVSMLSGGERRRLQLLSVITKKPNFLILDEPTNDLDIDTVASLEKYLDDFKGVLVVVSHDRFFTDKVCDHLFVFEGDGVIKNFTGSLSDYAEVLADRDKLGPSGPAVDAGADADGSGNSAGGEKLSYKEEKELRTRERKATQKLKREFTGLEPALEKLRLGAEDLQQQMDEGGEGGWTFLAELAEKLDAANAEIEEKELRWLELAEILEGLE